MTPEEHANNAAVMGHLHSGDFPARWAAEMEKAIATAIREAVAKEREACAKLAEADYGFDAYSFGTEIAAAIRARSPPA